MDKNANKLTAQVALNRTFNRINDALDEEGVSMVAGYSSPSLMLKGHTLKWHEGQRTRAYKQYRPPIDWDMFVTNALEIYKAKNHDYKQAFTKGLIQFGRSVWSWEVHKKLNRIRTWIQSEELRVKGEGVADSVNDILVYTTIYANWQAATMQGKNALSVDNSENFYYVLNKYKPAEWVRHLIDEGLIAQDEHQLKQVVFEFMAGEGAAYR